MRALLLIGASSEEAEDAAQEAMAVVYNRWPKTEFPHAFARKIAVRTHHRNRARRDTEDRTLRRYVQDSDAIAPDAAEDVLLLDQVGSIMRLLLQLPSSQREALLLYLNGFSAEEAADILGKTSATIRSNLRHAREKVRRMYVPDKRDSIRTFSPRGRR